MVVEITGLMLFPFFVGFAFFIFLSTATPKIKKIVFVPYGNIMQFLNNIDC